VLGTVHVREVDQLPQSMSPVSENFWHAGWVAVLVGVRLPWMSRAPSPP
jgi:hypothetical protein